ncbi:hypothetical protein C470_07304 [Halorubrum distributum JCM 13561]|uniref:Restriction endonuclease n=2 Tax=Halorubrum distributum TaxID=29283 RepID=M0NUR5_9EURY|nr:MULTISPECIES: hypothetical protein [Halorubrum distributum group]ELZ37146.1 hypothetical protein C473_01459 [Halorubrum terrestre JCM 10247]EMA61313.1 hypothetical protein C470_07304 [Halorubrum litoreum JCM 13561]
MPAPDDQVIRLLTDDPDERIAHDGDASPSESTIVDSLEATVNDRPELWAESEVNLWKEKAATEGAAVPPQEVVRELGHPLQPDIDLLVGSASEEGREGPLIGIEAKYFSTYNGIRGHNLLPKRVDANGNDTGGFYSGLGQALSLVSMGLDAVYLWHVFKIDDDIYSTESVGGDQTRDHRDVLRGYTGRITEMLDRHGVPIGYLANGVAVDFGNRFIQLCPPRKAPRSESRDTAIRELFDEAVLGSGRATDSTAPEVALSELRGSGERVTVEAEVKSVDYVKKSRPRMPDLKGTLRDPRTGAQAAFIIDAGVEHPYIEAGSRLRFADAIDHYYEGGDEVQLRVADDTAIRSE